LADQLKEQFGAEVTFEKGRGGVFDVRLDGTLLFSKHELDRFPEPGEVQALIRESTES